MMTSRCALTFAIALFAAAANCQPQPKLEPRFLNQEARQDFEQATLVVLGKVVRVRDDAPRPGAAGIRPIEVGLDIQRVLKGQLNSPKACFVYLFPYGGHVGPLPVWIEQGVTGIFSLVPGKPCFRAVNDRWAMIRVYSVPRDSALSFEQFVAQATLPVRAGCSTSIPSVGQMMSTDVWRTSIRLIGARATRRLLEDSLNSPDPAVRTCSCLVTAEVWKLEEHCLETLPSDDYVDSLRATNRKGTRSRLEWLRQDPMRYLVRMIESYGADGVLLILGDWSSRPGGQITPAECDAFAEADKAGALDSALNGAISGAMPFNEAVERPAMIQFRKWLSLGCPTKYEGFASPPAGDR